MATSLPVTVTVGPGKPDAPPAPAFVEPLAEEHRLTFPPFPVPPPGATIVPFKSFKPAGIALAVEDVPPDYVERDGAGAPTVVLRVKHSVTAAEQRRRGKRARVVLPNGQTRRPLWFEEWEDGETLRRTDVSPLLPRDERIRQTCYDFKAGRPWPLPTTDTSKLWDHFRLSIGVITHLNPPNANKRQRQAAEADDDEEEGEEPKSKEQRVVILDDEEARAIAREKREQERKERKVMVLDEIQQTRKDNFYEIRNLRTDAFFDNTEKNIKIFFSSYFREKGLVWSTTRCRDGPIMIEFFLRYLLRSGTFPETEYQKGFRKALAVIDLAKKELLHTFTIGQVLPDNFSKGCVALWGDMGQVMFLSDGDENQEDEVMDTTEDTKAVEVLKDAVGEANVEVVSSEAVAAMETEAKQDPESTLAENLAESGWGNPSAVPDAPSGGWDTAGGWGASESSAWGAAESSWGPAPDANPLAAVLGPTVLPLTHTTGVVERSTRRIARVVLPETKRAKKKKAEVGAAERVEDELAARLAQMVLAPWGEYDLYPRAEVGHPTIVADSRGPVCMDMDESTGNAAAEPSEGPKSHNPYKDEIIILIEPQIAKDMWVGMGLGATWVQIVRQDSAKSIEDVADKGRKKRKGGAGEPGEPTKFWYLEQLSAILPSYHTENVPHPRPFDYPQQETA